MEAFNDLDFSSSSSVVVTESWLDSIKEWMGERRGTISQENSGEKG